MNDPKDHDRRRPTEDRVEHRELASRARADAEEIKEPRIFANLTDTIASFRTLIPSINKIGQVTENNIKNISKHLEGLTLSLKYTAEITQGFTRSELKAKLKSVRELIVRLIELPAFQVSTEEDVKQLRGKLEKMATDIDELLNERKKE